MWMKDINGLTLLLLIFVGKMEWVYFAGLNFTNIENVEKILSKISNNKVLAFLIVSVVKTLQILVQHARTHINTFSVRCEKFVP